MPPRNPELPEGTDHIVNGAMGSSSGGAGAGSAGGASGGFEAAGAAAGGLAGGSSSGFIGGGASGLGDDTGGAAAGAGAGRGASGGDTKSSGSLGGGAAEKLVGQVRGQVSNLTDQATDKMRQFADTGKDRATTALDDFTAVMHEAARSVDERLGAEYGQYAHRAADAVSSFTQTLRGKSVDDLLDDSRNVIRTTPGVAIGAAAVLGFALVRIIKAGLPENGSRNGTDSQNEVTFTPDTSGRTSAASQTSAIGSTTGTGV